LRKILAEQSIPKIDDFTARLSVVLWERDHGHYVTHVRNDDDGGFANGHYGMTLPEAWQDFGERVAGLRRARGQDLADGRREALRAAGGR
jgi:hypothetical protein